MDLREKPGKVQSLLEILLRFRLIAVVAMVIAAVSFIASSWQEMVSFPLGASEALGMYFAEIETLEETWASSQFILVAALACFVMYGVFAKIRGFATAIICGALTLVALYFMGGNESLALPLVGIVTLVSIIMIIAIKISFSCGLFPFIISWVFFSGLLAVLPDAVPQTYLLWAGLSIFGFSGAMVLSTLAGKNLAAGMPQAGALVKAAKQIFAPIIIGSLLIISAIVFDKNGAETSEGLNAVKSSPSILGASLYFVVFNLWFFVLLYPTMSFSPWERLRSSSRRVELKEKKKPAKKK